MYFLNKFLNFKAPIFTHAFYDPVSDGICERGA